MAKAKEVAPAGAAKQVPALSTDFEDFAGAGMENFTSRDILIPRLTILQGLSPQLKPNKPEFIAGAAIGQICDTGIGETFPDGLMFLPVHYRKDWIEWAPRASGKGLVAIHPDDRILESCTLNEKGVPITASGNIVQETAQWFGINLSAGNRLSFIPMASTMLKRSKKWGALATAEKRQKKDGSGEYTAPLFARAYHLDTAEESNAQGDWATWTIERGPALEDLPNAQSLLSAAVDFRKALIAGELKADVASMREEAGEGSSNNEGAM